jgi:hypothetical protein
MTERFIVDTAGTLIDIETRDTFDIVEEVCPLLNEKEETIRELTCNTTSDNIEIKHINNIYKELGFDGVIEYAMDKLSEFGSVREVEEGLWLMATGGWSDHEHWLACLNDLTCVMSWKGHYRASTRGGGFYYTKKPYADIRVVLG